MKLTPACVLLVACGPLCAEVVTYPGPEGIAPSDQYAVKVTQGGQARGSFVYVTGAKWRSNRSRTTSWTTFSFAGKVTVEVRKLAGPLNTCRVLPSSYGIRPAVDGNTVRFALDRPRKVAVDFDDDVTHPMLVFADPLEQDPPRPGDPNVVYFAPGVHDVGAEFRVARGQTVYLAGGAYVRGTFLADDATGTVIRGRGVLSGERFGQKTFHLVRVRGWGTRGARVEDVTLVDSPHYNIVLAGRGNVVRNVRMISWWFSTDGVGTGPEGLVEDCFLKVNDDAVKLYFSGMRVRDCVIWQMENGAPFQISWNMPSDNSGFRVSNVDVIRCEHRWNNDNCAVFCSIHGGSGRMSDYLFEDIRIENAHWRLVNLVMKKTEFSAGSRTFGRISGLTFRNVTVDGAMKLPNTIAGHDRDHGITDVLFENVKVDGRYLTSAADGNFQIDPNSTGNVRFVVRPAPPGPASPPTPPAR